MVQKCPLETFGQLSLEQLLFEQSSFKQQTFEHHTLKQLIAKQMIWHNNLIEAHRNNTHLDNTQLNNTIWTTHIWTTHIWTTHIWTTHIWTTHTWTTHIWTTHIWTTNILTSKSQANEITQEGEGREREVDGTSTKGITLPCTYPNPQKTYLRLSLISHFIDAHKGGGEEGAPHVPLKRLQKIIAFQLTWCLKLFRGLYWEVWKLLNRFANNVIVRVWDEIDQVQYHSFSSLFSFFLHGRF